MKRLALSLLLCLMAASASAQSWQGGAWQSAKNEVVQPGPAQSLTPSLDEAVAQLRRETGGRVLSASTVSKKGRTIHRIKLLTPQQKVEVHEVEARGR